MKNRASSKIYQDLCSGDSQMIFFLSRKYFMTSLEALSNTVTDVGFGMQMTPTAVRDGLGSPPLFHRPSRFHLPDAAPCVVSTLQPFLCRCDRAPWHTRRMASESPWTPPTPRRERHLFLYQGVTSIFLPTCSVHCSPVFACRSPATLPEGVLSVAQGSFFFLPAPGSPG